MELHNLKSTEGSRKPRKRVGRGDKTAGRGNNGSGQRSGFKRKQGFEGGQMPLYKRTPKRGFTNPNRIEFSIININQLVSTFDGKKEITPELLIEKGLIKNNYIKIKILSNGEITKPLKIKTHKISKSAKSKIEAAGGVVSIIE